MRNHFLRAVRKQEFSYVGILTTKNAVSSTSHPASPPSGTQQNDLLIALNIASTGGWGTVPSGWTAFGPTGVARRGFWKIAGASEGSTTWTTSGAVTSNIHILAYRNAAFDTAGTTSADPAASITLASAESALILFGTRATATSITWSAQTGFTTLDSDGDATAPASAVYHKLNQPAGATGDVSFSTTLAQGFLVGVKPA